MSRIITNQSLVDRLHLELSGEFNKLGQEKIRSYQAFRGVQNSDAMAIAVMAHAQSILHILNYPALKKDARDALGELVTAIITAPKRERN